jgi:hypothetical protein
VVAIVPVQLHGANYGPTAREYEACAWKCAVDDKSVDPARKDGYSFKIEDTPWPIAPKSWS